MTLGPKAWQTPGWLIGDKREGLGFHCSPLYQVPSGGQGVYLIGRLIVGTKMVADRPLGLAPQLLGT